MEEKEKFMISFGNWRYAFMREIHVYVFTYDVQSAS